MSDDRIKVVCHGCGARYQVRASKVQGRRFRASCKKCGGIIVAHCSNAFTVLPDSGSGSPRQSNPLQLERDDLYQEEEGWYVVISGKPHGPLSAEQVRQSVESGRIGERTYLWRAGDPEWRRLGEVPEFMDLSGGGQTSYYQGVEPQSTGETRAAGPAGLRRHGYEPGLSVEDPTAERTAFFHGEAPDGSEQATQFHVRDHYAAQQPVPQVPQEQPAPWEAVPVIPPRPAILPAPTGAARAARRSSHPDAGHGPPPPSDFTRPLSAGERVEALGGGESDFRLLPSLAPAAPTGGPGDLPPLPPPKSVFSQSLKPIGPPAGPALLAPAEAPFWTTGKIAAAAAIGGGLAVAMAVVVVVSLVRPRPRPVMPEAPATKVAPPTKAAPVAARIPIKVSPDPENRPEAKAAQAKAAQAKAAEAAQTKAAEAKAAQAKAAQAKAAQAKAAQAKAAKAAEAKKRRAKARSRTRVTLRRAKPRRAARRPKKGVTSEVDALLAGAAAAPAAEKPESKGVDPDALLAVGSGRKPKAAPNKPDPDALLAAAQKPSGLSQVQVRGAMRPVLPQVRACYDKYQVPGLVKVRFTVQPGGSSEARVVGKFAGTPTGFCVLNAARSARFPSFSGGARSFIYPFKLE